MEGKFKNQKEILAKLGIEQLNTMQEEAMEAISLHPEIILLSPTGTGKTLAFLLPILNELDPKLLKIQALILVPSRELAIQIEQVVREMGSGFKANAIYGGRAGFKDKMELKHPPTILIGTPGRVADHMRRETFDANHIRTLVLDEFDKSLEVGFENEMREILDWLPSVERKIMTSATQKARVPDFVKLERAIKLNYLGRENKKLELRTVISPTKDKLETLEKLLAHVGDGVGIIFCNFKATIHFVHDFFEERKIKHACFYGGMEQLDRERALIKFRNGTHRFLLATDLAARGIDVPEMDFIIHFQLPFKEDEFTHRNGRTARMHSDGTAYMLCWEEASLPDYIKNAEVEEVDWTGIPKDSQWVTLHITGGRKDKISKGDIAGLFFKQGGLTKDELGLIELKQDCAYVSVPTKKSRALIEKLNNTKLKKRKIRISQLD